MHKGYKLVSFIIQVLVRRYLTYIQLLLAPYRHTYMCVGMHMMCVFLFCACSYCYILYIKTLRAPGVHLYSHVNMITHSLVCFLVYRLLNWSGSLISYS